MGTVQLLLDQRAKLDAQLPSLEAERDAHRDAWLERVKQVEAIKAEIEKINLLLATWETQEAKLSQPTIMQAVLDVLREKPEGMTALEILAAINERYFHGAIVRTSLSPQLSRLKDRDHKIVLRGNRWFLIGQEAPTLFTPKS